MGYPELSQMYGHREAVHVTWHLFWSHLWKRLTRYYMPDCHETRHCRGRLAQHGRCSSCEELTCRQTIGVSDTSLRRERQFLCDDCSWDRSSRYAQKNHDLRQQRRDLDWDLTSTPIDDSGLNFGEMGEQYPGKVRTALRAFVKSDQDVATFSAAPAGFVQRSINSLGLQDDVYAEQRGNDTVIRRTPK